MPVLEDPSSYAYYRNEGDVTSPRFVEAADSLKDTDGVPLFSDRQNIPNATDIDCDGQMDLLIGRNYWDRFKGFDKDPAEQVIEFRVPIKKTA